MKIGIDFGTTHTSAALYREGALHFIPLDPYNDDPALLRSLIYITREHAIYFGMKAAQNFLEHDTGRPSIFEEKVVGTIENTVARIGRGPLEPDGPITIIYDVVIDEDVGMRGRLLQSIKTGLRSASYTGTQVFDRYYAVEQLVGLILQYVRKKAEEALQTEVREAVLGRPVHFSDDPDEDRLAEARLRNAAEMAGFHHISFVPEPVAAANFYLRNVTEPENVFIFDFGGGTLDFTVLRAEAADQYQILATHGVSVGGDDLDSAIMRNKVARAFGAASHIDTNYDGRSIPFPSDLANLLDQWQTIPMLSRPQHVALVERAIQYGDDPQGFRALRALATQNYGFALFERIERAKRVLSAETEVTVTLHEPDIHLDVLLTRREFNMLMQDEYAEVRSGVRAALARANLVATAVDTVVTTGGSSMIPAFQTLLAREFPAARRVQSDTFGSVTGGLALQSRQP